MYTVVRFIGTVEREAELQALGSELNALMPGKFQGIDVGVPGRFSCSLGTFDDWGLHHRAIITFLDQCEKVVSRSRKLGFEIQFDTAIECDDCKGRLWTPFLVDLELMQPLVAVGGSLVFSLYH